MLCNGKLLKQYEGKPVVVYLDKHILTGTLVPRDNTWVLEEPGGPEDPRNPFRGYEKVIHHINWEQVIVLTGPSGEKPLLSRVKPAPIIVPGK